MRGVVQRAKRESELFVQKKVQAWPKLSCRMESECQCEDVNILRLGMVYSTQAASRTSGALRQPDDVRETASGISVV